MPDRIIRDELLESERFLDASLTNDDRMAWIAVALKADALGNLEGAPGALKRLWGRFDITAIDQTIAKLTAVDLLRTYEADDKRYLHLPRYKQHLRYVSRICPLSPWTTDEEKQRLAKNSQGEHTERTPSAPISHHVRTGEVKRSRSEEILKRSDSAREPLPVDNSIAPTPKTQPPQGFFEKLKLEIPTLAHPPTEPSVEEPEPAAVRRINGHAVKPLAALTKGNWKANQVSIAAVAAQLEFRPQAGETFAQLAERCDREISRRKASAP